MESTANARIWKRLILTGVVLYVVFLLVLAPAWLGVFLVDRASGGQAVLENPTGTIWRGSSNALVLRAGGSRSLRVAGIRWSFAPARLLHGELAFAVSSTDPNITASGEFGFGLGGSTTAHAARLTMATAAIVPLVPILDFVQPAGTLHIETDDLKIGSSRFEGQAIAEWRSAGTKMSPVRPLGDYRINLNGAPDGMTYDVTTLNGPLRIDGKGSWSPSGVRKFAGTARADPPFQPQLVDLLRLIGREQGQGVFALSAN